MTDEQNALVIDLIIRYDSRTNEISLTAIPQVVNPDTLYGMLDAARWQLRALELQAISAQKARDTRPPETPGDTSEPPQAVPTG